MRKKLKQFGGEEPCYAGGGGVGSGAPAKSRYVGHGDYKLAEGGEVTEGPNKNIGDDTRARALAWLDKGSPEPEPVKTTTVIIATPKSAAKAPAVKADTMSREVASLMGRHPAPKSKLLDMPEEAPLAESIAERNRKRRGAAKERKTPILAPAFAAGGSIDGCAQRGKTRGKVV